MNFKSLSEKDFDLVGERMLDLAKELYPYNRSILGPDIRFSLQKFINLNPEFNFISFPTGTKVFDWQIPEEWIIKRRIADYGLVRHTLRKMWDTFFPSPTPTARHIFFCCYRSYTRPQDCPWSTFRHVQAELNGPS